MDSYSPVITNVGSTRVGCIATKKVVPPRCANSRGRVSDPLEAEPMSERNPPRLPPYSPHREYDPFVNVLVFRDVPEDDWLTVPRPLDPGAWAAGIHDAQLRTQHLADMPYDDYLASDEWRRLRVLVIDRAGGRCERCRTTAGEWNVHHLTYERRGHELLEDLILLCRPCHMAEHGIAG